MTPSAQLLLGLVTTFGLTACGSDPHSDGTVPAPEAPFPEWSLTVGEPNEHCPGAFDRSVSEWNNEDDVRLLNNAIAGMPKNVKLAACRVAKFTVEADSFFATGFMQPGSDPQHSEVGFHPALFRLKPSLSQLLVWKDRQIVEANQRPRFETDGAPLRVLASPDDFGAALSYVVAHELGHLAHYQPEWHDVSRQLCSPDCEANSWEKYDSVKPGRFEARDKFCFYDLCEQRLSATDLPKVYAGLATSDFISLYAATNVMEDVAETYAATVIFDAWQWTWKTTSGEQTFDSAEHWISPQMAAKRDVISKLAAVELPPP